MKKLIAIIPFLFVMFLVSGQEIKVPDAVIEAFENKYPDIDNPIWKFKNNTYQVHFKHDEKRIAYFSAEAKWLKTATMIDEMDLPDAAVEYIIDNYENADIRQVQYIITNKKVSYYLSILELGEEKIKLKFNDEGELID